MMRLKETQGHASATHMTNRNSPSSLPLPLPPLSPNDDHYHHGVGSTINNACSSTGDVAQLPMPSGNSAESPGSPAPGPEYRTEQAPRPTMTASSIVYYFTDHFAGDYDIGDMYHDMSFDEVHFNVMGFTPQQIDLRNPACTYYTESTTPVPEYRVTQIVPYQTWEPPQPLFFERQEVQISPTVVREQWQRDDCGIFDQSTYDAAALLIATSRSQHKSTALPIPENGVESLLPTGQPDAIEHPSNTRTIDNVQPPLRITTEKQRELVDFLAEIRPIRPDGTLIDGNSSEVSLANLQAYLDLFFKYFNTSYPLIHTPTLDINATDVGALSSFILLGATYRDKDAHQLSVCLYNAIVPYILNTQLCSPVPDLAILQALLVLECYGMYRAGPYQRENAILIHGMLLNVNILVANPLDNVLSFNSQYGGFQGIM